MKIKPLDDRVLIKALPEEQKTPGGLYIPDTAKEKPRIAEVIEVGSDEELQKVIQKGDKVLFGKYSGDEIKVGGEEYILLQRSDILALIED
ncbi:MAG TPA: co-chaperone GroES [Candidatus Marinimicrobia bacterium]|nr:co-chaperone GroES [Candidatus Neomarinimicrobiota bacterium]